ncbi:hypothetical protein [Catellatospora citrea]|uniref:Secreted protein n=1 Tax=Catellatospora citrea TaxID=53366 RepID=A0A8J3KG88_9ACTN|nr:hypothetical protein [Catellatospora citrea]RKE11098.1 hypothetical protein C8E86_6019 [Catellatospora citrea]GIF96555.1 hypothetical protein Cci01nite_16490 [Catellatospora citrea]
MSRVVRSLAVAAAGLAAFAVASPAQASSATRVLQSGHVQFFADDTHPGDLMVDVSRQDGVATLDVEWYSQTCQNAGDTWSCDYVWRRAFGVTPTVFDFSLRSTTVVAAVTYRESRYTCSFDGEQETCTDLVDAGTASTDLSVTWTATERATTSTYRDETGALCVSRANQAPATGSAFGETYVGRDQISALSQQRCVG